MLIPGMSLSSEDSSQKSNKMSSTDEQQFYEEQLKTFNQADAMNDAVKHSTVYEKDDDDVASDSRTFSYMS